MMKKQKAKVQNFLKSVKRQHKYEKKMKLLQFNLNDAMSFLETDQKLIRDLRKILNNSAMK